MSSPTASEVSSTATVVATQFPRPSLPVPEELPPFPSVDIVEDVPWAALIATHQWKAEDRASSELDQEVFLCAALDCVLELPPSHDLLPQLPTYDEWHTFTDECIRVVYETARQTLSLQQRRDAPTQRVAVRFLRLALNTQWTIGVDSSSAPGPRWIKELDAPDSEITHVIDSLMPEKHLEDVRYIMRESVQARVVGEGEEVGEETKVYNDGAKDVGADFSSELDDYRLSDDNYYEPDDRTPLAPGAPPPFRLWYDWGDDDDGAGWREGEGVEEMGKAAPEV